MTGLRGKSGRVLDLFSGAVGAWSLGMHRAGYVTVAACEADPWRRAIFAHNFPNVRIYTDVRLLTADELVRDLGYLPDVIVGSPPCQDASAANTKGRGVDGERTGLFFEAVRLVGECRPRWCAFENSPRLRTRGYDRIADALEKIGYAPWPLVVGADDLEAPHERKRVWIVAADTIGDGMRIKPRRCGRQNREGAPLAPHDPDSDRNPGSVCASSSQVDGRGIAGQCATEAEAGDTDRSRLAIGESLGDDARAQLAALERAIGPAVHSWNGGASGHLRVAHGLTARLADVRVADFKHPGATINAAKACISAHGDAILPQIAEAIGRSFIRVDAALSALSKATDGQP